MIEEAKKLSNAHTFNNPEFKSIYESILEESLFLTAATRLLNKYMSMADRIDEDYQMVVRYISKMQSDLFDQGVSLLKADEEYGNWIIPSEELRHISEGGNDND